MLVLLLLEVLEDLSQGWTVRWELTLQHQGDKPTSFAFSATATPDSYVLNLTNVWQDVRHLTAPPLNHEPA